MVIELQNVKKTLYFISKQYNTTDNAKEYLRSYFN